jgi:hypothetical protein
MNSDLTHRLSSSSNTFNDQPVANPYPNSFPGRSSLRPPPLPVLFPSVFNEMLHPSQTEDGLHYSTTVVTAQAQVLLNLRCNDVMPKTFPHDKTCCAKYPNPSLVQILFLAVLVLFGPFAVWLKGQRGYDGFRDNRWVKMIIPSEENIGAMCTFGFAIGLCYVVDRTGKFDVRSLLFMHCVVYMLSYRVISQGTKAIQSARLCRFVCSCLDRMLHHYEKWNQGFGIPKPGSDR